MNRRKVLLKLNKIVFLFEIVISILLMIGILISVPDIFKYYINILGSGAVESIELFKKFLSHVFLLVIAMEFVLLMVAHNDTTIVHLVTLVIARKMLIYTETLQDILIGVISLAVLFIIRKYLIQNHTGSELISLGNHKVFSASSPVTKINEVYNYDIDSRGAETLGGLISKLLEEKGEDLEVGKMLDDGKYIYEIQKIHDEGLIEEVSIHILK
ncbi:hypothetical protein [Peptoniphilus asaccharolyticus]